MTFMQHKPGRRKGENQRLYQPEYESRLMRGVEEPRPWDIQDEIAQRLPASGRVLDIGCGTAVKILPLAKQCQEVIGLEPSEPMRKRAEENIKSVGLTNSRIVDGVADDLPFEDESIDVVTNMLSPDNPDEIYRVLKPGGYAIIEKLGERDKAELKAFFGSDAKGLRGQLSELELGERRRTLEREYRERFKEVTVSEGTWKTYYSHEGLLILLENTSVVRGFDLSKDEAALKKAGAALATPKGILAPQHRILLIAQK